jgi:hypothetical protein
MYGIPLEGNDFAFYAENLDTSRLIYDAVEEKFVGDAGSIVVKLRLVGRDELVLFRKEQEHQPHHHRQRRSYSRVSGVPCSAR